MARTLLPHLPSVLAAAAVVLAPSLRLACQDPADPPPLTLSAVLEAGPALASRAPRVLFRPGGHDATLLRVDDDGVEALFELDDDGATSDAPICTPKELWGALGVAGDKAPKRMPPLRWLDDDTLRVAYGPTVWHWDVGSDRATRVLLWQLPNAEASPFGESDVAVAPGDGHVAVRRDHQLWLTGRDAQARMLTHDGSEDVVYGGAAHRAELGITEGMFWSADGRYLAFYREDMRPIAPYPYQDVVQMPPAPRRGRYPMAGQKHSKVTLLVCDTTDYRVTTLAHDPDADLYWTNVGFTNDGDVTVALIDRGQEHMELARFDPRTGERRAVLVREHDAQWIEPEHPPTFLGDGRFLWWSRRSGFRHLYLHAADGALLRPVTRGAFDVQALLQVDEQRGDVWFQAAGDDPRQLHLFVARLDEDGQRRVTRERGSHDVALAPDATTAAVTWSNLETPPTVRLVTLADGASKPLLQPADPTTRFTLPQQRFFDVTLDDGTVLHGHVALPPKLDEGRRYPVLLYVYGGPHAQLVTDRWLGGASTWLQAFANEGFVVCRLDNRGTPHRGIEFEQQIHRRLGTLEVEDQLRAVAWLKRQPFVDPARIGVHGWSFGGYMTLRLMLLAPETFACGVSGAPVTDWAMYETGYGERYMDTPQENPAGYQASSCLPIAGNLRRPLLLVHGSDDRTVMWSHTLQFVDRCVDAGVDLDYFVYPQQLHGLRGADRAHFLRKMLAYLRRHLQ